MADTLNTKTLVIEPEMLDIIAELDEFKGAWRALSTLAPERLSALRRVATIESIGSSTRIEGSKLSDQDVEKMLSNVEIRSFETRDEQEVAGYAGVMETIFASWSVLPLTENHVRQLHRDLLRYSTKDERHRGDYKKLDNHVEAFDANGKSVGVVFQTASPFDTPRLMAELIEWTTDALSNRTLHPLLVIAVFVVVFMEIHPFPDGNGRLSPTEQRALLKAEAAAGHQTEIAGVIVAARFSPASVTALSMPTLPPAAPRTAEVKAAIPPLPGEGSLSPRRASASTAGFNSDSEHSPTGAGLITVLLGTEKAPQARGQEG